MPPQVHRSMRTPLFHLTITCALLFTACAPASSDEAPQAGRVVYSSRVDDGNSFSCASCHALREPDAGQPRRAGHPLAGAPRRPHFKNGEVDSFLEATNSCLQEWMNADSWDAEDPRFEDLVEYLTARGPAHEAPVSFTIVPPPSAEVLDGGDPEAGRALFNASCAACHGEDGVGTEQGIAVHRGGLDPVYVATRVRLSGNVDSDVYPGLQGGIMPFWSAERLSDDELRDLVAWLSRPLEDAPSTSGDTGSSDDGDDAGSGETGSDDSDGSNCPQTHPTVGYQATLTSFFHGVGGTAEIVDDCTIVIRDFTYDGTGIDVRIYGGIGGNYDDGFSMSEDLLKPGGYDGVTLTITVPADKSLDALDGISIWCVDVGVDFGSGQFEPPR